ncbi:DMT family transporter [Tahibacter amnicola]|uniref:DMT family transporter n=1 Tax=Tahibacter amnicola TaxID=2976241 RepID=A0ABY6BDS1_9GAMM|nr:DMT family transporter [Tahibacter amnicola]UXI68181.1 DMT family transporter [Tahibacter amnicola]
MTTDSARRSALVALLLLTLVWGYNWIVMKQVLRDCGPFHFAAIRAVLATLVLVIAMALRGVPLKPPPLLGTAALGLFQTTAFQGLVQWALVEGAAGKTALLVYTMPFWLILPAWWLLHERPRRAQLAWTALAGAGLVLVLQPWRGLGGLGSALLALAAGLAWSISVVISKRMSAGGEVSALSLTTWQMGFGAIGLVLIALLVPERAIAWTPGFIAGLAYNAVLASGLAWVLWAMVVQRLPATVAGITSLAVPLTGFVFAWVLLGERPLPIEAGGIALVAAALVGITRPARQPEE